MVEELLEEYRKHQVKLVAPHQRLQFELNTLCENCDGKYRPDVMCTVVEGVSMCSSTVCFWLELSVWEQSDKFLCCTGWCWTSHTILHSIRRWFFCNPSLPVLLPSCCVDQDNPGPDCAALTVVFHPPDATKIEPLLFLSPRVERLVNVCVAYDDVTS